MIANTLDEYFSPTPVSFIKTKDKWGLYITSERLAELLKVNHSSVKKMINQNLSDLLEVSVLNSIRFNERSFEHGGRPEKVYYLNEAQAVLIVLLSRNTKASRKLKNQIVENINDNADKQVLLAKYTDLLLKQVTGMNAKQLKASRHVKNAMDGLTTIEQAKYQQLENIVTGFIGLNKTYDQIKGILLLTSEVV